MKSEAILDLKATDSRAPKVFGTIAEHLVKDADHFVFCRKQIESLIPGPESGNPVVSTPMVFFFCEVDGRIEQMNDGGKYTFSYKRSPEEKRGREDDRD